MNAEKCPERETVLSVLEGSQVSATSAAEVLYHLSTCGECRNAASFVCAAEVVGKKMEEERVARRNPFWKDVILAIDRWAGRDQEMPDAMAAAEPKRVLVFQSKRPESECGYWRAEVELAVPDDPTGSLNVRVTDAQGNELVGDFFLCGVKCSIEQGEPGKIPMEDFRKGHTLGGASFARHGESPIEGVPVLGSIL